MRESLAAHLAQTLDQACLSRRPIPPLSESNPELDLAAAYEVQTQWNDLRLARGDVIIGRKIGLTSIAVQQQLGVDEPDYGTLWRSNLHEATAGRATVASSDFIAPRVEGEVAFLIRERMPAGEVTAEDVLAATEACALAIEIVDSRIVDWRIKLTDTVADNASFGGVIVGPWDPSMRAQDLASLDMQITCNGEVVGEGSGGAVLGNPARSTAWLVNKLRGLGVELEPGEIVISGAFCRMAPAKAGDLFVFSLTGQPELSLAFI